MLRHIPPCRSLVLPGVLVCLAASMAPAADRLVPGQYTTIQAAINAAVAGDVAIVSPGTYRELIRFGGKAVTVRSSNPADPAIVAATIIHGDLDANPATSHGSVVRFDAGETRGSVLDGLTITGGTGQLDDGALTGGGVFCLGSAPTIRRCRIVDNRAYRGAGVYCNGGSPLLERNVIAGNVAGHSGGGLKIWNSCTAEVRSNLVLANRITENTGAGIDVYLCPAGACPWICHNTIAGNSSQLAGYGAGISCSDAVARIDNNIICSNGLAAGIWSDQALPGLDYNDVWGNAAGNYAGAAVAGASSLSLDPLFVSPAGADGSAATWADNDYHLRADSPCVNAGDPAVAASADSRDIDGGYRVLGGRTDMGADETSTGARVQNVSTGFWYDTIQQAVDDAAAGQQIVLQPGTYTGDGNRDVDFRGKAITVRSSDPEDAAIVAATIVDCEADYLDQHRGFWFHSGEGSDSVLAGITVTRGYLVGDPYHSLLLFGAGILCEDSSPTISHCVIDSNSAMESWGSGIACIRSSSLIIDCTISRNTSRAGPGIVGGGIYGLDSLNLRVVRCTLEDNYNEMQGAAAIALDGGSVRLQDSLIRENTARSYGMPGISCWNATVEILGCTITENVGMDGECAGIYCSGGTLSVRSSTISHNYVLGDGGISCYGTTATVADCNIEGNGWTGIGSRNSSLTVVQCKVVSNGPSGIVCTGSGSASIIGCMIANNKPRGYYPYHGVYCEGGTSLVLVNCSVVANIGTYPGAGLYCQSADAVIRNCIIWGNDDQYPGGDPAQMQIDTPAELAYCCVQDQTPGDGVVRPGIGNIDRDPLFVSMPSAGLEGDLRLLPTSPCLDAGINAAVPADSLDLDHDGDTSEPVPLELTGRLRFLDTPTVPDTGSGTPPIVDIGAYEGGVRPGDVDGDGYVDVVDLLYLVDSWGKVAGEPGFDMRCDFNGDDAVDVVDLLILVENFGV